MDLRIRTHQGFKSYNPSITNVNDLYNIIKEPLTFQHKFNIQTSNEEIGLYKNFRIDVEMIDRLYYVRNSGNSSNLIVRVNDNRYSLPLYIQLTNKDLETGKILVTQNLPLFLKRCKAAENITSLISQNEVENRNSSNNNNNNNKQMVSKINLVLRNTFRLMEDVKDIKKIVQIEKRKREEEEARKYIRTYKRRRI